MAKRFSRLKWAQKNQLTGTPLTQFKSFRSGDREVNYTRETGSKPEQLIPVYLTPFGEPSTVLYQSKFSKRASEGMGSVITDVSLFNHKSAPADPDELERGNYKPAKAVISKGGTLGGSIPSKITGISYKPRTGAASFSVPFGAQGTANATAKYKNVCIAIAKSVETKDPKYGVTFKPEVFSFS